MEIKFNVDASKIAEDVSTILKSLTEQERKDLAKEALLQWITKPCDADREIFELHLIQKIKAEHSGYRNDTDERIREGYQFREGIKTYRSKYSIMMEEVQKEAIAYQKTLIKDHVAQDPEIKKQMDEALAKVKDNFGSYVHDAMMAWFCSNMQTMAAGMATALMQSDRANNMYQDMNQRLLNRGM